jgi:hypothetical protein
MLGCFPACKTRQANSLLVAISNLEADVLETTTRGSDPDAKAGNVAGNCRFQQFLRIVSRTINQKATLCEFKTPPHQAVGRLP